MVCKGICVRYKATKPKKGGRHIAGQKMCSICDIFVCWDGKHCPCCNFVMSANPRTSRARQRYIIAKQVKRI